MKMIQTFLGALLLAATAQVTAADTAPFAMARSAQPWQVVRTDDSLRVEHSGPVAVRAGDQLAAGKETVRVQGKDGSVFLLTENSSAIFPALGTATLEKGTLVSSGNADSGQVVTYSDLTVKPIAGQGNAPASIAVRTVESKDNREIVEFVSLSEVSYEVSNSADGTQVATIGKGDVIRLERNGLGGWSSAAPLVMMQQEGEEAPADETEEGGAAAGAGAGTGAAAGGGAAGAGVTGGTLAIVGGGVLIVGGAVALGLDEDLQEELGISEEEEDETEPDFDEDREDSSPIVINS